MTFSRKYLLALAAVLLPLLAAAQTNGSNSPYSRFGFGLLSDGGNAFNKGMSGTAYGMRSGSELNTKNPASYASIDSLSFIFDFGVSLESGRLSQNGSHANTKNTSVDYLTAGFRMAPRLGMVLGLAPYSTIGYEMSTSSTVGSEDLQTYTRTNTYSGDGGLHTAYVGVGWAPVKPLSVGVNVGYLWGDIEHTSSMSFSSSSISSTSQSYEADIRSYKVDFGLQYEQRINAKHSVVLGLAYGLGHNINRTAYYYNNSSSSVDTVACHNAFQMPHTLGAGLTWNYKNSLRVGADYTWQKWSSVKAPPAGVGMSGDGTTLSYISQKGHFNDLHKVSVGAEYTPNPDGLRWRQRIRYRAGLSYANSYVKLDNNAKGPSDFQASLGVALPIVTMYNNRTYINFSAQYERVKPKTSNMITENYFRFSIGLTFNERWFMKWKAE